MQTDGIRKPCRDYGRSFLDFLCCICSRHYELDQNSHSYSQIQFAQASFRQAHHPYCVDAKTKIGSERLQVVVGWGSSAQKRNCQALCLTNMT